VQSSVINSFHVIVYHDGTYMLSGIKSIPRNVVIQLTDIFIILPDRSNNENWFLITFGLYFFVLI
jgi:hypothetical protein